jgi:hypothetical protein
VQSITADVSNMTPRAAINAVTGQAQKRGTTWRITVNDVDGQKTPSIAIMVGEVKEEEQALPYSPQNQWM